MNGTKGSCSRARLRVNRWNSNNIKNMKDMEENKQLEQPSTAAGENRFRSRLWGVLTFYPTKGCAWKDTCRHCLLLHGVEQECAEAKCHADERADGRNGYYSIHNMPMNR